MKKILPAVALFFTISICQAAVPALRYRKLNRQAAKEYLVPIRPGYEGRNPFWNGFAKKFIYAPAFDFSVVDGAVKYRFTVSLDKDSTRKWTFCADTPTASLSPVWNEIPVAKVRVVAEGIDRKGKVLGLAGTREFKRDYPFRGPYRSPALDYRESALMGMLYVHNMPQIQHWKDHVEPDMSYSHHTYANKVIGATICMECLLAREIPSLRDEAIRIARHAAQFLIDQSCPADHPLAGFPPTYYKDLIASKKAWNQGKTMTMDALRPAEAFLDLYDATGEKMYLSRSLAIAQTYAKLQRADGSFPTKVDIVTGEPVNAACAMLHPLVRFLRRLETQYGVKDYQEMLLRGERWMQEAALESFDMEGQFEDINILNMKPYQDLTNCTAAPYASYLLTKDAPTKRDVADAVDLIRMSEDQFAHWDITPDRNGLRREGVPNVHEQYKYEAPVVSSCCNVANACLDLYLYNGDMLAFAKAKALIDNITHMQYRTNGFIPTTYFYDPARRSYSFWINCTYSAVCTLLRMAELSEKKPVLFR